MNQYSSQWGKHDTQRFIKLYPIKTRKELLSLFPGKTIEAIRMKAYRLQLKKERTTIKAIKKQKHINAEKQINMRPLNLSTTKKPFKTRVHPATKGYRVNSRTIVFIPITYTPQQIANCLSNYNKH